MISLDAKAFFWQEFNADKSPINPKECQIIFSPQDGGKLFFLDDLNIEFIFEDKLDEIIPVIYGQAVCGKKFTLINAKYIQARVCNIANLELTHFEYSVEYIFNDGWIDIDNPIEVIHVRYSYLELWLGQIEIKHPIRANDKIMAGVMIHQEYLKCSSADCNILLDIKNNFNQSSFNNKLITYEATNALAIAKKDNFTVREAINLSIVVKSFFELIIFYSKNKIFIEEFDLAHRVKLEGGYEIDEIVHLLFKQDGYEAEKKISHLDFLFTYKDIKENFVKILNNWIKNHSTNQNEYSAFCNVIADKSAKLNIYSHYFQLISALEGYHRRNNDEIETCHDDEKEGINFRKRLNELVKQSEVKSILNLNSKVCKSISNYICDMRNDIAHSKKIIEIDDKAKSSFEYLKIVALLIMLRDISLNHTNIQDTLLEMRIKDIEQKIIEAFGVKT